MKRFLVMVLGFLLCAGAGAEMYKSVDKQGNVIYSDIKTPGATEIKSPSKLNTIEMPKPKPEAEKTAEEPDEDTEYEVFSIIEPENDAIVWSNSGVVIINLLIKPALDLKAGHRIVVYLDDELAVDNGWQDTVQITDIDRGSHALSADIRDKNGRILISSNSVQVEIKRKSSLHDKQDQIKKDANTPGPKDAQGNSIKPGPQGVPFRPGPIIPPPAN